MIHSNKYPFTELGILMGAPLTNGVYALWDGNALIYYGSSSGTFSTVAGRLRDHLSGREGRCTQHATHFQAESTAAALTRERDLINEYLRTYGRLPRCNDVRP